MILIERTETNPYFNIAAEEYILRNFKEDVLMLWESDESIILGKHQNAYAELDLGFVNGKGIPVIRRISGGGTVFHGPGNINITVIKSSDREFGYIDFKEFTKALMEFLKEFGIETKFEGKNNLTINGLKFSGNSAHIFKSRVLHHGTILFDADLDTLDALINESSENFKDKAVKSIRANVTNIKEHINENITHLIFKAKLKEFMLKYYNINKIKALSEDDKLNISNLVKARYGLWKWNYAYSPEFEFSNKLVIDNYEFNCKLTIKNAIVQAIEIEKSSKRLRDIEDLLVLKEFNVLEVEKVMIEVGNDDIELNQIMKLFKFK